MVRKHVAFPRFSHYNLCIKYFVEQALDAEYIMQPPMTNRTMEIGSHYSPDSVCTPFKTSLGSMVDALEAGADTLVMTLGFCRLGYYGELQEKILRELGYEFDFVNLSEYSTGNPKDYLKALRKIAPKASMAKMTRVGVETLKMLSCLDEIEAEYYKNCGFELHHGDFKQVWNQFLAEMETAENLHEIEAAFKTVKKEFSAIPVNKPEHPLRVGVIGEYYTAVDAFSNLNLEQKLADMGVEVHRWMNVTNRNLHYHGKNLSVEIKDYCKYEMGPTSTANIWCAKYYASHGFDGIIHAKSAGCTPEIDIMPVLQNISSDYKIPTLYLSYDSQTSDTGLDTRLEAFYDMIQMRKKAV
ncbi:MAG: hypothetical protein Q4F83_12780 [Eubacteriales bacterium]|nr:hypothetical protein [Eubacteriales bacterium]